MRNKIIVVMVVLFLFLFGATLIMNLDTVGVLKKQGCNENSLIPKCTIVIDAGHGGFDPGKIGVNDALEKDINLAIAKKLKKILEQNDIEIIMIRETDEGLYQESDSNKKSADLKKRVEIINSSSACLAVSIHQNSFPEEKYKGAQVFYHNKSSEGKICAEIVQKHLKETLQDGNHRFAKPNESYYMLKKTDCPLIIVECGFLSNWEEAKLLASEEYQDRLAWAIHLGILDYLNHYVYK